MPGTQTASLVTGTARRSRGSVTGRETQAAEDGDASGKPGASRGSARERGPRPKARRVVSQGAGRRDNRGGSSRRDKACTDRDGPTNRRGNTTSDMHEAGH